MLPQCNPVMRPRNARPSTRGPQSAYRPAERAEGGLCALRAAPNPMSEREHELHRRMTSLTERHRAWPRSWARTERAVPRDPFAGGVGSSPHTRGARAIGSHARLCRRDHPRIRGEHSARLGAHAVLAGIIPAYAGNTSDMSSERPDPRGSSPHTRGTQARALPSAASPRDHPRIRGEHGEEFPRAFRHAGIIPAYAGNTRLVKELEYCSGGDHPPHTRGTLDRRTINQLSDFTRMIPAYAGDTAPKNATLQNLYQDHCRIRGEHGPNPCQR